MRLLVVVGLLLLGCLGAPPQAFARDLVPISGAGSTWSDHAISAWQLSVAKLGMTVSYTPDGSAAGLALFAHGAVDFAVSDIPAAARDRGATPVRLRPYGAIPATAGAVAFEYNLHIGGQQVTNLRLSGTVIAGIFTGRITRWNDQEVAADNPGLSLPAEKIVPVVRTDSSGATEAFTEWMTATQFASWAAYCRAVGLRPCAPTPSYPVLPGRAMIGQTGDTGVAGYIAQPTAEGAIGFTEYAFTLPTGFPVANVLNEARYYTEPTPDNVGLSLLEGPFRRDPRSYELSYYSDLIMPASSSFGLTQSQGYTLAQFGAFALCQGQQQVDPLGYAALPVNLVRDGYAELLRIPGAGLPARISAFLRGCGNPTFGPDGTDRLTVDDPMPPACDQQGPAQCGPAGGGSGSDSASVPITVTVPPAGTFSVTVAPGTVTLTDTGSQAAGVLDPITVSDTRNSQPGWSLSGQAASFTGTGGAMFSGNQLGWLPTDTALGTGVTLGGVVVPVAPGLGSAPAVLAQAPAGSGFGTSTLSASLTLAIPAVVVPGTYTSSLTLTTVTSLP